MRKIKLGQSTLEVTELCFGTMYFGSKVSKEDAFQLLDQYMESGGNFIDTSNNYAFWMEGASGDESENTLGDWIRSRNNRQEIILATKVGARPRYRGAGMDELEGLSFQTIVKAVEGSLKRLKTDYIDLYYAHVDWYDFPIEERLKAFDQLKWDGKIREIGASNIYPWRFAKSQQFSVEKSWPGYCCVQQKYSYLRPKYNADFWVQKLISGEWLDYAGSNHNFKLIAYSPLLSGAYSSQKIPEEYDTEDSRQRMKVINEMATELNVNVNQLVLCWMMQGKPEIIPLIAASKPFQLKENLEALEIKLSDECLERLTEAGD